MNKTRTAILNFAENRNEFRFSELLAYLEERIVIRKVTLCWYLRGMVEEGILYKLGRGLYTAVEHKNEFYKPYLRKKAISLAKKLALSFPYITISVFDGRTFADFQHHLSINNTIYIETERESMESVFHFLRKKGYTVFLNPTKNFVYEYIDLDKEIIIIKPLISESPLLDLNGVRTPSLEKILVDILCDDDLDYLHGSEIDYIFENAISMYAINQSSLLRYASRRNAKTKLLKSLKKIRNHD